MTSLNQLPKALTKMEDDKVEIQDPLVEVNLGTMDKHRLVYVNSLL